MLRLSALRPLSVHLLSALCPLSAQAVAGDYFVSTLTDVISSHLSRLDDGKEDFNCNRSFKDDQIVHTGPRAVQSSIQPLPSYNFVKSKDDCITTNRGHANVNALDSRYETTS